MPPRWFRIAVLIAACLTVHSQSPNWAALSANAKQLVDQSKFSDAIPVALQALQGVELDQRLASPTPPNVSAELTQLGEVLLELGAALKAESVFAKAFAIDAKLHGPQDPSAAADMLHGGQAFLKAGKNVEAERLFRRALDIHLKALGGESAEVARDNGFLAEALCAQGRVGEAQPLLKNSLAPLVKKIGPDHPDVAQFINQMGILAQAMGRPWDAFKAYEAAVAIDEKKLGPGHPATARIRGNMAVALVEQGNYEQAVAQYQKAIDDTGKAFGPNHPQRARLMADLAVYQMSHANVQQACLQLQDAVGIMAKTIGSDHPDWAAANSHLADCYRLSGDFATAVKLLNASVATDTKALGQNHPEVAEDSALLGSVARDDRQFPIAERYYLHALEIDGKVLGPLHPKTQAIALQAALNYVAWQKPDQAEPLFELAVRGVLNDLTERSFYMSEGDRLRFLKTVPTVIPSYFLFAYTYPNRPGLIGKMYNLLLTERGFAASSSGAIRARILSSGDKEMIARFDALTQKKRELAALQSSPEGAPAEFRANVDALAKEVNRLEEGLAYYSPAFASKSGLTKIGWADVQKALQPGEAAVEYLRFVIPDGRDVKGYYAALVLTKDPAGPKLIPLGDAVKVEDTVRSAYAAQQTLTRGISAAKNEATGVSSAEGTRQAYLAFWKPLEPALAGVKRIYVAADGILNQFPIGLLGDENGRFLFEKYDVRLVNSTKDLVESAPSTSVKSAVLMGNPSFNLSEAQQRAALAKVNAALGDASAGTPATEAPEGAATRSITVLGGKLPPLPATQTEVEAVAKQLASAGWQVKSFTGDLALEESLAAQKSPRLLHLATHGFFLPDRPFVKVTDKGVRQLISIDDPMLRSGLFFAGADRAEGGAKQAEGLEDGILTSFEATQLNLQGTELVVLSACETGRGQQQNGEGVFGLRRALQEAGAQSIMMSMWSVPDKETQELMTLFYQKWLGGADKHEALRQAQLEEREVVKKRYGKDLPFYWGAFVLVGR